MLILTARSSWQDKVEGLQAGRRRLPGQAVPCRRAAGAHQALRAPRRAAGASRRWSAARSCSTSRAQTVSVNGSRVDLTSYEYKVLEYLMMHAGELVSKADLTEHIYQQDFDRDCNVLEVFIGRLRKQARSRRFDQTDRDRARPRLPLRPATRKRGVTRRSR